MSSEDDLVSDGSKKRRINKSPTKYRQKEEGKLDAIMKIMRELREDVREIRREQELGNEEIKKLREENGEMMRENRKMRKEIIELSERVERLEMEGRKNNVIMQGMKMGQEWIKQSKEEVNEKMEKNFREKMEIEVKVKEVIKLGKEICLIKLEREKDKEEVMMNKHKLKQLVNERIYINNDETKEQREKGRKIREIAKEYKKCGKEVKMGYNKIIVDGMVWKWNKERGMLEREEPKTKN